MHGQTDGRTTHTGRTKLTNRTKPDGLVISTAGKQGQTDKLDGPTNVRTGLTDQTEGQPEERTDGNLRTGKKDRADGQTE